MSRQTVENNQVGQADALASVSQLTDGANAGAQLPQTAASRSAAAGSAVTHCQPAVPAQSERSDLSNQSVAAPKFDGVNVAGYLTAESGVGAAARGYVNALQSAGIKVALNNFELAVESRKSDRSFSAFAENNPYPINLICINADQIPAFVRSVGEDYFRGKHNIGVWWWELPDFPEQSWSSFRWFDEIWVGSSFIQQSLSRYSPVPIVRIPPSVSIDQRLLRDATDCQLSQRAEFGLSNDEYLFLFMFDFFSGFERKNPLGTIRAFKEAFQTTQPVRLVMKCINSSQAGDKLQQLQDAIGDARITVLDRYLSASETESLIASCDAYVSLHRSEGLGLPLVEAMLLQKPVIATGWSGNTDFMTSSNSYLLPYKLIVNDADVGPYRQGEVWAEADISAASQAMRQVFSDRAGSRVKAKQGAVDAAGHFAEPSVAAMIEGRLTAIRSFHPDSKLPPNAVPAPYLIDQTVRKQLEIIADGGAACGGSERAKSMLRRICMPIVERAGYLSSIYLQLFRQIFENSASSAARLDLIDSRTRGLLSNADARIRSLETEIADLKSELRQLAVARQPSSGSVSTEQLVD